jgi:hypothetical protein
VESGEIGEDREARLATLCFIENSFPHSPQGRIFFCDFDDSHEGDLGAVGYEFDSGFAHARSAHSEKLNVGARAQSRR